MEYSDIIWMAILVSGSIYIIYRSVWKKKGYCHGCNSDTCSSKKNRV